MNEHTEQFPFQSLQGEEVSRKLFKDVTTALLQGDRTTAVCLFVMCSATN